MNQVPETPAIDVQTFLNEHPFSAFQWLIFALCFCVVLMDGFDTSAIGFVAPSLVAEWGIARPALGPVLSAALFGLAAGAITSGPLADWLGRKTVLIVSVLVFGLACLASGYAANIGQLTAMRFVTGLGLGAAMPNAVTLISEYCPDRKRALLTNAMFCGFPLGAAFGGFLAAWMIPHLGWRSVFHLGGVAPLALVAVMLLALPESARYLAAKGKGAKGRGADHVRKALARISASAARAGGFTVTEAAHTAHARGGIGVVLSPHYLLGSVMLWIAYFMGLVIFYALINWMPLLFKDVGIAPRTATLIAALFPIGGCGAIVLGWLMDRFNADRMIAIGYGLTAVSIWAVGQASGQVGLLMVLVFVSGTLMNTAQSSMQALAAAFYPTRGRATGVAWMLGIGRFGGIAGSFLVAELARRQLGFSHIFAVVAVPGLIAAVAVMVKHWGSKAAPPHAGLLADMPPAH